MVVDTMDRADVVVANRRIPMKAIAVFVPIVSLLIVGLWIALKSGGVSPRAPWRLKAMMGTVSSIFMQLAAYLLLLFGLQTIAGFPVRLLVGD